MDTNKNCPDCKSKLKPVVYGLVPESVAKNDDVIIGGCLVDGNEPHFGCSNCGYQGFPGGRTYKTKHSKPKYKFGTENTDNPEVIQVIFDVVEATEEQLWGWAEGLWEARLELLHRGVPKDVIEQHGLEVENWDAMPFDETELGIIQYDPASKKIIGIGIFYAHGNTQSYTYRLPGMNRWGSCFTMGDFHHVQGNFPREANLQTWQLMLRDGQSEDAFWGEDTDLDHPLVKAMLDSREVSIEMLEGLSPQFERFFIWPAWFFEPTVAFALGKRTMLS